MKNLSFKKLLMLIIVGLVGGCVNGLFGAGAGLLLVPLIKIFGGLDEKKVHATTLSCVMIMCVINSIVFLVNKQIYFGLTLWCLIGSLIGAVMGTFLLQRFKNKIINLIFSCMLIVSGVLMFVL